MAAASSIKLLLLVINILTIGARPLETSVQPVSCILDEEVYLQCPGDRSERQLPSNSSSSGPSPSWFINNQEIGDSPYYGDVVLEGGIIVLHCSLELDGAVLYCEGEKTGLVLDVRTNADSMKLLLVQVMYIFAGSFFETLRLVLIISLMTGSGLVVIAVGVLIVAVLLKKYVSWTYIWRCYLSSDGDEFRRHKKRDEARAKQEEEERDHAVATVKVYLSRNGSYTFDERLSDLGCRLQKYWFHIKSADGKQLLLIMLPVSTKCSLELNSDTTNTLNEFFEKYAQECPPYVHLVHKISYVPSQKPKGGNGYVIIIQDWCPKGSLRDKIQNLNPEQDWVVVGAEDNVYETLNKEELVHYGRQILEALRFFNEEGFPPLAHVHSGNIYIDDTGNIRVGGYENTLLGYRTKLYKAFYDSWVNWDLIDVFMFGHVLYEMATGQTLECAIPTDEQCQIDDPAVTEILQYIFHFNQKRKFWSPVTAHQALKKIRKHKFFKGDKNTKRLKRPRKYKRDVKFSSLVDTVVKGIPVRQQDADSDDYGSLNHSTRC